MFGTKFTSKEFTLISAMIAVGGILLEGGRYVFRNLSERTQTQSETGEETTTATKKAANH